MLIPHENKKDIEEVPTKVLKKVELILVEHMDAVLEEALIMAQGEKLFLPENGFQPFALPKGKVEPQVTAH